MVVDPLFPVIPEIIDPKRTWPIYWNFLDKRGCSNLSEQQALLPPAIKILKGYDFVVIGDREFHSVELANCLQSMNIAFAFRQKAKSWRCQFLSRQTFQES